MKDYVKKRADKIYNEISSAKKQWITLIYPSESYNSKKGYELWVEDYKENVLIIKCDFEETYLIQYEMVEIRMYSFDTVLKFLDIIILEGKII